MKAPLVIMIVIVVAILGFLTYFSQQREVTTQARQGQAAGYASAPASGGSGPAPAAAGEASGGVNASAPASGGDNK